MHTTSVLDAAGERRSAGFRIECGGFNGAAPATVRHDGPVSETLGAIFVKGLPQESYRFSFPVFLFDPVTRLFVPTHSIETPAPARAVKDGA
jgi:hypothetical protein